MEEAAFLFSMHRIVGGIHVQDEFLRRFLVAVEEQLDQQPVQLGGSGHDALVAVVGRVFGIAQLHAIEGTGARQRMAAIALAGPVFPVDVGGADGQGEDAVGAELVVVVDVLVAQHEAEQALGDQLLEGVFAAAGIAVVAEAAGEAPGEVDMVIGGAEQESAAIGRHASAIEAQADLTAAMVGEGEAGTGCGFGHDASRPLQDPDSKHVIIPICLIFTPLVRYPG